MSRDAGRRRAVPEPPASQRAHTRERQLPRLGSVGTANRRVTGKGHRDPVP